MQIIEVSLRHIETARERLLGLAYVQVGGGHQSLEVVLVIASTLHQCACFVADSRKVFRIP
jgi:hypothetical protein